MIENKLTDIPETMLITLWAKAEETKRKDALLHDEKAADMVKKIEYDFSKFSKAKFSQAGCCVRASLMTRRQRAFLPSIRMRWSFSWEQVWMQDTSGCNILRQPTGMTWMWKRR